MVKLVKIHNKLNVKTEIVNQEVRETADVIAELYADSVSDLSSSEIEGLDTNRYTLTGGSYAYDKSFNIYVLDSSGHWKAV